jgi:peptidoglycan/xylan/chitin deacetylase (PgdA/CDA1 family)
MDKNLLRTYSFIFINLILVILIFPFVLPNTSVFLNNITVICKNFIFISERKIYNTIPDSNMGSITIIFDDGYESQYSEGYAAMKKCNIVGNVAVIPTRVGEENYMTLKQISDLYLNGWDILNHTYNHENLNALNYKQQLMQIIGAKLWFKIHGFKYANDILVFPGGINNEITFNILDKYKFKAARGLSSIWTISPNARLGDVIIYNLTDEISPQTAITLIDDAIAKKEHCIFIIHKVEDGYDSDHMKYSINDFKIIINYISSKKDYIQILSMPNYLLCLINEIYI